MRMYPCSYKTPTSCPTAVLEDSLSLGVKPTWKRGTSPPPCTLSYKTQAESPNFTWTFPEWKRLSRHSRPSSGPELSSIAVTHVIVGIVSIPRHPEAAPVGAWLETIGNLLVHKIREYNLNIFFETVLLCNSGWPQTYQDLPASVSRMLTTLGWLWFRQ